MVSANRKKYYNRVLSDDAAKKRKRLLYDIYMKGSFEKMIEVIKRHAVTELPHDGHIPSNEEKLIFYKSFAWALVRIYPFKKYGRRCQACGCEKKNTLMCADHIKPLSKYWHLRLDPRNLQVLCDPCNQAKSNLHETDYRDLESINDGKLETS